MSQNKQKALVIVAHPDDEILWCGGTILLNKDWDWHIITLCRASDPDRAPKFYKSLKALGAKGDMADLDDSPDQHALFQEDIRRIIKNTLHSRRYDYVFTHGPEGEYTRHKRHEECSQAVLQLFKMNELSSKELRLFAYEDGRGKYMPKVREDADIKLTLPQQIWEMKYQLMTGIYGFSSESWEAKTTPKEEGFYVRKEVTK